MTDLDNIRLRLSTIIDEILDIQTQIDTIVKPDLVTVKQACDILSISRATLYNLKSHWEHDTAQGVEHPHGLPFVYLAGDTLPRIRRADINRILSSPDHDGTDTTA